MNNEPHTLFFFLFFYYYSVCTHSVRSVSVSPSQLIHSVTLFRSILGTGDLYIYIGHIDDAMCDPNMCLSGSVSERRLEPGSFDAIAFRVFLLFVSRCWDCRWRLLWIAMQDDQSVDLHLRSFTKQKDRKSPHTYPCVWFDEMSLFFYFIVLIVMTAAKWMRPNEFILFTDNVAIGDWLRRKIKIKNNHAKCV